MRVKENTIPLLDLHVARIVQNSRAVGLADPPMVGEVARAARRSDGRDHAIRLEWDGTDVTAIAKDLPSLEPMKIVTVSVPHPGYRVKTTQRAAFDAARQEAHGLGADEGLLLTPEGLVAEGTLFAVGWFQGDLLCLPTLDLGILPSIGRARVIRTAEGLGISTSPGSFPRGVLNGKPVFATTATRGVVPISMLDGVAVPSDDRVDQLRRKFWMDN